MGKRILSIIIGMVHYTFCSTLFRRRKYIRRITLAIFTLLACGVSAQEYPHKAIRFIVPFPPGGATDVIARLVGQKLSEATGQPVIVDSRGGGATIVGTEIAARAAPDGYTMLLGTFGFAITPALHQSLPYDTLRDFSPVSLVAQGILVLVAHPSTPVTTVRELIALAKAKPGQLNYGSVGGGTSTSLAGILFKSITGVQMTEVAYKGSGLGLSALLAGEVNISFSSTVAALPFIKSAKLRALGVSSAKRADLLPDVPTLSEAGAPGYELTQWYGILLPGRTPRSVVSKLHSEIVRIVRRSDVKEVFTGQGLEPITTSPAEFSKYISMQVRKWSDLLEKSGVPRE